MLPSYKFKIAKTAGNANSGKYEKLIVLLPVIFVTYLLNFKLIVLFHTYRISSTPINK